jgi:hypothetical protein
MTVNNFVLREMTQTRPFTFRIKTQTFSALEKVAKEQERPVAYIINKALEKLFVIDGDANDH